ncbi:hypothetical protein KGQ34_03785, partial [Patescibacteria group bacterium]|nr:hypothetical protein [Patescibacteria group bacterium]
MIDGIDKKRLLYLPRLFTNAEKIIFGSLFGVFIIAGIIFITELVARFTVPAPADGGTYREGLTKEPRLINPIYLSNNDTDRDLTNLIFSGLLSYDPSGALIPDLAERYEISSDGKQYTFFLHE